MIDIQKNIPLSEYTTFRIGGVARYFIVIKSEDDLRQAVDFAKQNQLPVYILGGGSNLLVSDKGVDGLVLKMEIKGTNFSSAKIRLCGGEARSNPEIVRVIAGAGEVWDDLVAECVNRGLYGLENLSHIPGTVGASVVQNIGAYGTEVKDVAEWVEVFDSKTGEIKKLTGRACEFGYRDSIFKKPEGKNLVVIRVAYNLKKDEKLNTEYKDFKKWSVPSTVKDVREIIIDIRKNKLPDWKKVGTAGSFFKNPIITKEHLEMIQKDFPEIPNHILEDGSFKIPLAYILEKLGWKDSREERVGVHNKQPLILVNYGEGRNKDVQNLVEKIKKDVKEKTGIDIEPEVVMW